MINPCEPFYKKGSLKREFANKDESEAKKQKVIRPNFKFKYNVNEVVEEITDWTC